MLSFFASADSETSLPPHVAESDDRGKPRLFRGRLGGTTWPAALQPPHRPGRPRPAPWLIRRRLRVSRRLPQPGTKLMLIFGHEPLVHPDRVPPQEPG